MAEQVSARRMPRTIDDPPQVFFWSLDELVVVMVCIGVGLVMDVLLIAVIISFLWARVYRKFREGRPDGFMQHWVYWNLGLGGPKRPSVPNSFVRQFYP